MRRRDFIAGLGSAAAWPLVARAQQGERVRRVGVLISGYTEADPEAQVRFAAFRQGLANLGWIEGRNLRLDVRWAGGGARCCASAERCTRARCVCARSDPGTRDTRDTGVTAGVRDAAEIEGAIAAMAGSDNGGLLVLPDVFNVANSAQPDRGLEPVTPSPPIKNPAYGRELRQ
jgi:hypothetical protein